MKRIYLSFYSLFSALLLTCNCYAQNYSDQLLIFRNTGEVTLLHISEMDSIITSRIDAESKINDKPTSQVFFSKDTTLVVPIAEIDSVSFDSQNEIVFNAKVKKLSKDTDIPWILRFDGNNIFYRSNTPQGILPSVGQYLFYNQFDETFPCGLTVKVVGVTAKGSEIEVKTVQADYTEIFDKFFYAGPISGIDEVVSQAKGIGALPKTTAPVNSKGELKATLPINGIGETSFRGTFDVSGDVVLHPFRHYYHADLTLETEVGYNLQLQARENTEVNLEPNIATVNFPLVAGIFKPSLSFDAFLNAKAELNFNYDITRHTTTRVVWERKNGKQTVTNHPPKDSNPRNVSKTEIILNGSIYLGIQPRFDFNLIGDGLGARVKLRFGPEVSGEISMKLLSDLSERYIPELYGSAEFSIGNKFQIQAFGVNKSHLLWGEEQEHKFFEYETLYGQTKIDLFPHFFSSRAVEVKKDNTPSISVATKSKNGIANKVETGFQVVSKEEKILSETFVDEIKADTTAIQAIATEIPVPEEVKNVEDITVRPVFKYSGKTIPFTNVGISQNPSIQPIIASGSNGSASFVSGVPIVGTVTSGNTTFHVGPYIPVAVYDKDFHKTSPYMGHDAEYVGNNEENILHGTWKSNVEGKNVMITFGENTQGKIDLGNGVIHDATYYINCPQSGYITINSDSSPVVIQLINTAASSMTVKFRTTFDTKKEYVFKKLVSYSALQ